MATGPKKGKSNIENYNDRVAESKEKVLNLQNQINQLLEKEFVTQEKLTRSEQKYAESIQTKLNSMMKTRNLLGRNLQLRKDELKLLDKQTASLSKIADLNVSHQDLAKEYLRLQLKMNTAKTEQEHTESKLQAEIIKYGIEFRRVTEAVEKHKKDLLDTIPIVKKLKDGFDSLVKNPLTAATFSIKGVTKVAMDFNEQIDMSVKSFGAFGAHIDRNLQQKLRDSNEEQANLNIGFAEIADVLDTIGARFGTSVAATHDMARNTADLAIGLGMTNTETADLQNYFINIVGLSEAAANQTIKQTAAFANMQGVMPQAVMRDIAQSSEFMAQYTKDTGENILTAALQATKLGLNLETVNKISSSVLNFQQSIKDEFELSVLLGKRVDLRAARLAFLNKDVAGGFKEIQNQLQGINLNNLDALTYEKLATSLGMGSEELRKIVQNQGRLTGMQDASKDALDGQDTSLINASSALTDITKAENYRINFNRTINEQIVSQYDNIQKVASAYEGILRTASNLIGSIGVITAAIVVSMGALVAKTLQYVNALRMANRFARGAVPGGGGLVGPYANKPNPMRGAPRGGYPNTFYGPYSGFGPGGGGPGGGGGGGFMPLFGPSGARRPIGQFGSGGMNRMRQAYRKGGFGGMGKAYNRMGGTRGLLKGGLKAGGRFAAPLAVMGLAMDAFGNYSDPNLSAGGATLKTLDQNKAMLGGAALGFGIGGPIGAAIGAGIGGIIDFFTPTIGSYGNGGNQPPEPLKADFIRSYGSKYDQMGSYSRYHSGGLTPKKSGNIPSILKGNEMVIPLSDQTNPISTKLRNIESSVTSIRSVASANNTGTGGFDYQLLAAAVTEGNLNYARKYGIESRTDKRLDKTSEAGREIWSTF